MADEREILTWPDFTWRGTDRWIMFPWSSDSGDRELTHQLEQWHSHSQS